MKKAHAFDRINTLFVFFGIFGFIILGKLFFLQVLKSDKFQKILFDQHVSAIPDEYDRGNIYFTKNDGSLVAAATMIVGFKLAIQPNIIVDPDKVYTSLAKVLPTIDKNKFYSKVADKKDTYEEIEFKLNATTAQQIKALNLTGVQLISYKWRYYPAGDLASQLVGFVGYKGDKREGVYGLERQYDSILASPENRQQVNIFAEVFRGLKSALDTNTKTSGDIITTIEPDVQLFLHDRLARLYSDWHAESVGAIVMDPHTGAVIAMDSQPSFNKNDYGNPETVQYHSNPLVESVFEMGSIFKPLVLAMGIEQKVVTPDTSYFDTGSVVIGDYTIHNYDKIGRGQVTMMDVIGQSLNTGMVFIEKKMAKSVMRNYIDKLDFASKSGVDLPSEPNAILSNVKSNNDIEWANISFGQGIAVTPISMIRALSTLANGGILPDPYVVSSIKSTGLVEKDKILVPDTTDNKRVYSAETVKTVTDMLVKNVDEYLRSGKEKLPLYSIAAKTGTAQISDGHGGYFSDRNLHVFMGYYPASNPRIITLFYAYHPIGAKYSSETLTDPFMDTAKFIINYYDIPPDRIPPAIQTVDQLDTSKPVSTTSQTKKTQ